MARGPDPLAALLKLRALEVAQARRDLSERLARAAAAAARTGEATEALRAESQAAGTEAGLLAAYAAWRPQGEAARQRAAGEQRLAEAAGEAARQALAEARVRERAVEWLRETAAREARERALRQAQAALDEAAARRRQT